MPFLRGSGISRRKNFEIEYAKSENLYCIFGRKMVPNAANNVFLKTLTIRTPFPCVPAAFQQWERLSDAFPLEIAPAWYLYCAPDPHYRIVFRARRGCPPHSLWSVDSLWAVAWLVGESRQFVKLPSTADRQTIRCS